MACSTSQLQGVLFVCFIQPHLQLVQVANVELWDSPGPAAHANDLGLWGILGQQHFPEVLVHLQQGVVPSACTRQVRSEDSGASF